jgi:hypothetical protein
MSAHWGSLLVRHDVGVRLGLQDRGFGLRSALVELGDRGIVYLDELRSALQLLIGVRERRLGGGELRLALFDRGLERLLLDRENDLAFS